MAQPSAKGHRASSSRVIPAIPHALGPKPRAKIDQHPVTSPVKPQQTPPESRDSSQAGTGKEISGAGLKDAEDNIVYDEVKLPSDASETAKFDAQATAFETSISGTVEGLETSGVTAEDASTNPLKGPKQPSDTEKSSEYRADSTSGESFENPELTANHIPLLSPGPAQTFMPAEGLVFGSNGDSSPISPTFNASSRAAFDPQSHSQPHPGPRPGATPFVPQGHAYHLSEPIAGPSYIPPFSTHAAYIEHHGQFHNPAGAQNGPPQSYRNNNGGPPGPPRTHEGVRFQSRHATPPYVHPAFNQRTPPYNPPHVPKYRPTAAIHPSIMRTHSSTPDRTRQHLNRQQLADIPQPGAVPFLTPSNQPLTPDTPKFRASTSDHEASLWLGDYIHDQFGISDFADIHLSMTHTSNLFAPTTVPGHGLLLARSPKLRSLMAMHVRMPPGHMSPFRILDVTVHDRFLNFEAALSKAIMRLYADSLPDARMMQELASMNAPHLESTQGHMHFSLAYAAAGHFLQMGDIVSHGLDMASSFLDWKNVDRALAFALDGGLGPVWHQRKGSQEDRDSTSSFDGSQSKSEFPLSTPTYGYYSDRLLERILQFVIESWPKDFVIHTDAAQLDDSPRLPASAHAERARSRSHLTRLRFGEMTMAEDVTPEPDALILSSILFSLPLPALRQILESEDLSEKLGGSVVAELTRATVTEREQRRGRIAAQKEGIEPSSALEERLWDNVRWVELVEESQQHPSGVRITRQRLDSDTPPTSNDSARS